MNFGLVEEMQSATEGWLWFVVIIEHFLIFQAAIWYWLVIGPYLRAKRISEAGRVTAERAVA